MKIVITGGHLTPAIAVISELKKEENWDIFYFGRKTSMEGEKIPSAESKIIPELGVKFIQINTGRFQRKFTRYTIPSLLRIPWGFLQSFFQLIKIRPSVVCSFGSYVSVPVVIAAWILRIPILTHEQTITFGLASKINSYFATKIAVSFPQSLNHFKKDKVALTGNPIRKEIFDIKKPSWIDKISKPIIYITGGSQGSVAINEVIKAAAPDLLSDYVLIHQTGEKYCEEINKSRDELKDSLRENYYVLPYINSDEIGWVMEKSKLIISRAGANTICEIAILGKVAIFIPLPFAFQDEQTKNARILEDIGMAKILPQNEFNAETLKKSVTQIMNNFENYQKNSQKAKELIIEDASKRIVEELKEIIS